LGSDALVALLPWEEYVMAGSFFFVSFASSGVAAGRRPHRSAMPQSHNRECMGFISQLYSRLANGQIFLVVIGQHGKNSRKKETP